MRGYLTELLKDMGFNHSTPLLALGMVILMVLVCLVIYAVLEWCVWGAVKKYNRLSPKPCLSLLIESNIFTLLVMVVEGVAVNVQARLWLTPNTAIYNLFDICTRLWILVFALLAALAAINLVNRFLQNKPLARKVPFHGIGQALKLILLVVFLILFISILLGRSPVILLSGLGAMTAVLMLIFKDPIVGFVSGLQLSSYDLLAVGDWIEMPKYNANGDVLEIGLTTVKVQNWDKTIVSIPTYALMSDSFKNWRGMQQAGGRRIKRSLNIDVTSIHFLTQENFDRLKKAHLISDYLDAKVDEIERFNRSLNVDTDFLVNGRHLTNVGTFRAYLECYLKAYPSVRKDMTIMVRQLDPTPQGLPLEIYCFANTVKWDAYERIQSDIFDHIYAVMPEFGLRAYQSPTGHDFACV